MDNDQPTDRAPCPLPTRPELAAIALFAVAIHAQLTVNIKLFRAAAYRLARLG